MSGRIPQEFINEVIARADIVSVVGSRVELRKAGRDYKGLCPFHQERTPSFTVSPDKQFYYCFGCGAKGTALGFLIEHEHLDFVAAVEALASMVGLTVPRTGAAPVRDPVQDAMRAALAAAQDHFRQRLAAAEGRAARQYLQGRGVSDEIADRFGIGWAPDRWDGLLAAVQSHPQSVLVEAGLVARNDAGRVYDRFRGRLTFPIRNARGVIIGFGGRSIDGGEPKYLNSPETPLFHKGRELYGWYECRRHARALDAVLVAEGYMDVIALAQHHVPEVVGVLGTAVSVDHLLTLYRATSTVVVSLDGDAAGRRAAWRTLETALPLLEDGRALKFLQLPEGEDPDSLIRREGAERFRDRVRAAVDVTDYLFDEIRRRADPSTISGRARGAALAAGLIARVPEGVQKRLLVNHLAEATGLSIGDLVAQHRELDGPAGAQLPSPHPRRPARATRTRMPALSRSPQLHLAIVLAVRPDMRPMLSPRLRALVREAASADADGALQLLDALIGIVDDAGVKDRNALIGFLQTTEDRRSLWSALGPQIEAADATLDILVATARAGT